MIYEYLLRIDGSGTIDDTIESHIDLELKVDRGLVIKGEYYKITDIVDSFIITDNVKIVYIVDVTHCSFENLSKTIQTKILWEDHRNGGYRL